MFKPPAPSSILIVRLSSVGDLLRFLPLAGAARRRYPDIHITWAVGARCREVVEMCREVDEVLVMEADPVAPRWQWPGALLRLLPDLRRRRYDVAIDAHSSMLTLGVTMLARASRRLGIDKPVVLNLRLFPHQAVDPRSAGPVEYHLSVLRFLDIEPESLEPVVHLDPGASARDAARGLLADGSLAHGPRIAIHHDTSLQSKRWQPEKFSSLANRLRRETGAGVMVIGERLDARMEEIRARCDADIVFQHGLSLRELTALFEQCDVIIAQESGPLHLAAALSRPTVGIFGPSDPAIHTPYGDLHHVVRKPVPCSPCFKGFDFYFACPLHTMDCLNTLDVDDVMAAARQALARGTGWLRDNPGTVTTAQ